jgi:hypothetical protein
MRELDTQHRMQRDGRDERNLIEVFKPLANLESVRVGDLPIATTREERNTQGWGTMMEESNTQSWGAEYIIRKLGAGDNI